MAQRAKTPGETVELLLSKAVRQGDCLISHLAPNAGGYVPVQIGGRNGIKWRAHRLVYAVKIRAVSPDLMVLHKCDVRNCINPDHLFIGTAKDNTQDMMNKGRHKYEIPNNQKADGSLIRKMSAAGMSGVEIASALNLSTSTISNYLNGEYNDR